jgi:hypothetical protein
MWRIGQSWGSKENPLLVTIVEEGKGPQDDDGRRQDDRLIGCAGPEDAQRIVDAINAQERDRRIVQNYGIYL